MRDLSENNCYVYDVSRFFADLEVELKLVFRSTTDESLRDLELVIGKRRKYNIKCNLDKDVYMLVQKDDIIVAFDKMELLKDDTSETARIDIESYLCSKNYTFSQLDSKSYSRARRKREKFYRKEINQYDVFDGIFCWLDIEVYTASAKLFPNTCKIGENDIVEISYSYFSDDMVKAIRTLTMKKQDWNRNVFKNFFSALAKGNEGTIKTTGGKVLFGGFLGGELEIIRTFEDGEYNFRTKYSKDEDEIEKLGEFAFDIMKAKSLEDCKNIECFT